MNSYLLIGLESLIDHIGCIRDLGIAYWKKANKKMQIGDIVYLFISDVEHNRVSIMVKGSTMMIWRSMALADMCSTRN